ncbi:LOW QUALITY PROTEIN: probable G-protein coupled receptor 156 [Callorhinchus milii]|uniref:LOW QUALITY PROTEIN: probable G-protein coupled receptor 156 n=1 Tax=Callorhinchus milii TaxID=7868 RepID=UPI001C3FCD4D|nr:LOW QUALITY PROTEIN: probable G-protein coupled receptor 156 [Callorhinchus milii]
MALNCSARCSSQDCTLDPAVSKEEGQRLLQRLCTIRIEVLSEDPHISPVLFGVMCTLLLCGILLSVFFLAFTIKFKSNRIVKMSSPNLNVVTLLGSVFTYVSGYMFGIEEGKTAAAGTSMELIFQVRIWILCIGTSLVFGPILGKTWRLYKVFTQRVPEKRVIIKDIQLLGLVAGVIGLDILVLVTWGIADPLQCRQSLNAGMKAIEKDVSYSITAMKCCMSHYTEIWIILISVMKGSLLLYGTYLAGLTSNVSSPPVNQSITIMVGVYLIIFTAAVILPINRFLNSWPNVVYGLTSGGIFICTSTINCLIFIPQIKQWKQFEEELSHTPNQMAKYFNSPSKSYHSMYSDEQIYYLLGENNSMKRLLTEKNAVIESLQEQVSDVKDKLLRLMEPECAEDLTGPSAATGSSTAPRLSTDSEAECRSSGDEHCPKDFSPSDEGDSLLQALPAGDLRLSLSQGNSPLNFRGRDPQVVIGGFIRRDPPDHLRQLGDSGNPPDHSLKSCDTPEITSEIQTGVVGERLNGAIDQTAREVLVAVSERRTSTRARVGVDQSSASAEDTFRANKSSYVSSEKLQEILHALSARSVHSVRSPPRPRRIPSSFELQQPARMMAAGGHKHYGYGRCISPHMMRRRRPLFYPLRGGPPPCRFPDPSPRADRRLAGKDLRGCVGGSHTTGADQGHSKTEMGEDWSTGLSIALTSMKEAQLPSNSCHPTWLRGEGPQNGYAYNPEAEGKCTVAPYSGLHSKVTHWFSEGTGLGGTLDAHQYDSSDSESSSSDETFCYYHRPHCEACCEGLYDSSGSSSSETSDSERYNPAFNWSQSHRHHPAVNFKEDLKPTFV